MQPEKKIVIRKARTPLQLKLAGMFAVSFALFFMLLFGYDLLSGFFQSSAADAEVSEAKTSVVIDPKIAADLGKVLALAPEADTAEVRDPFVDRAGLSGVVTSSSNIVSAPGITAARGSSAGPTITTLPGGTTVVRPAAGSQGNGARTDTVVSAIDATRTRYEGWVRSGSNGPVDPRIFSVEDLLPVGIVDGGNGGQEVMFFSEAIGKTVSFPVGTLFFDGWLSELRADGVVFSSNDQQHTTRMRLWARSLKSVG
jgi:hypothetical protein